MRARIRETLVEIDWISNPLVWGPSDLQNRITTASFVYEQNQNPSITFVPQVGDDVRINADTATGGNFTLFYGHIAQVERGGDPISPRYRISCQDLNYLFDKIRLPADLVYAAGKDDASIAMDMLLLDATSFWGGQTPAYAIGFTFWETGPRQTASARSQNLPAITFKAGSTISQALAQLATLSGAVWYLDPAIDSGGYRVFRWNDLGGVAPLVFTTSPDAWPNNASPFYNYAEFNDRTTHYHRVRVDNGGALSATADDWVAFANNRVVRRREYDPNTLLAAGVDRILEGARVSDNTLTTQAQVTQRAWQELNKGRIRRTINLTFDRGADNALAPISVGMLVDVVHATWDGADVVPTPTISREVGTHSAIRGELVPGSRGRYIVQKVTPRLKAKGVPTLYSYDLVLGDYEDSLEATLAKVV